MSDYTITDNVDVAALNEYIGEIPVVPKRLDDVLSILLTGEPLPRWVNCYYGTPDERLKEVFGYE